MNTQQTALPPRKEPGKLGLGPLVVLVVGAIMDSGAHACARVLSGECVG